MVSGNISSGKSTLCQSLVSAFEKAVYIEENYREIKQLPEYYEEAKRIEATNSVYNKYALPVQLDFLNNRYHNELESDKLSHQLVFLDRCLLEDYHIFAKTIHSLGELSRIHQQQGLRELHQGLL